MTQTTLADNRSARALGSSSLRRRAIVATTMAFLAALLSGVVAAPAANAITYNPYVHLQGHVTCWRPGDTPRLIQVWSGSQYGQAGFNWASNYGIDFNHTPDGSVGSRALITCDGWGGRYQFWRGLTLSRPLIGTDQNTWFAG